MPVGVVEVLLVLTEKPVVSVRFVTQDSDRFRRYLFLCAHYLVLVSLAKIVYIEG